MYHFYVTSFYIIERRDIVGKTKTAWNPDPASPVFSLAEDDAAKENALQVAQAWDVAYPNSEHRVVGCQITGVATL